jgi:hypothetical protein
VTPEPDADTTAWSPRRVASIGVLAAGIGAVTALVIAVVRGGGLGSTGYLGYLQIVLLPAVFVVLAVGAAIAVLAQRPAGVTMMLAAALFEIGYSLGQLATVYLLAR